MARAETDTPRLAKRRKLDDTTASKSVPAKKRSAKEKELDLYDDIDGGLTKSEPKKRRGWKGWVEINEDEEEEEEEEDEKVVVPTSSKRQAKLKAKETLSGLSWTQSGKSKDISRSAAVVDNADDEKEEAIARPGPGRSTARKQTRRKEVSSEESSEDLPDAESPTKTPSRRKRGALPKEIVREDKEMTDTGTATKSTGRKRRTAGGEAAAETPSKSRKQLRELVEDDQEEEADEEPVVSNTPSKDQKQRRQHRRLDDTHDEPEAMDLDRNEIEVETTTTPKAVPKNGIFADYAHTGYETSLIKSIVLSKLTQRRPVPLTNLDAEYAKVHQLLEATVTSGESNSMLLIGARGSGKTALINKVLLELSRSQKEHFHIVRLNGFIQTDDKLALREIWRQLGREMETEDEEGTTSKSYADTLAMLLALLSHPDEISGERGGQTAKSVLFIIDEFDLFATHPRQTLLYNLLDIAQSRKAPIAVLGLTTRIDVTEALEKRVKSRFSHRYVHLNLARTLGEFVDAAKAALKISSAELDFDEKVILGNSAPLGTKKNVVECWNGAIDSIFANTTFQRTILHPPYHTSKSLPTLFSSLLLPISSLTTLPTPLKLLSKTTLLAPPSSNLHLLASLSNLALSLLIAAARLSIIHNTTTTNFPLAYAEYVNLSSKARINANAAGQLATGSGMRVYGKEVATREWEGLVKLGLCVRVGGGAFGAGNAIGGGGGRDMVRVDVALEEIPLQVELGKVMEKWCKQI